MTVLRWSATPKLWAYLALGGAGLVTTIATGRGEALALAAPFLVVAAAGLVAAPAAELELTQGLDRDRAGEGDEVELGLGVAGTPGASVDLTLDLPPQITAVGGPAVRIQLGASGAVDVALTLVPNRWGAFRLGTGRLRLVAPFGMLAAERDVRANLHLRVYPPPEALGRLVQPSDTALVSGVHVSRHRGPGLEFAELRPYRAGDRVREVNWRATARRGSLFVNERHPERSVDVVVLLDTFTAGELPRAVTAADAVVRAYLQGRDRLGLVVFGGAMRWVRPGMGVRQQYLVLDALLDSRVFVSEVWRDLRGIPPRVLPPKALILAVTPLGDPRGVAGLLDLDDRGFELAVLALQATAPVASAEVEGRLADRLRRLQWESTVEDLRARGVPVAVWGDQPVGEAIEELSRWPRRHLRAR